MQDHVAATAACVALFRDLAELLRPLFPHYSQALTGEIVGTRMNEDRWNRVAAIVCALRGIPGTYLVSEEHEVRNIALSSIPVAKKMAEACFGHRSSPAGCLDFATWLAAEISGRMATLKQGTGQE